jgi:hypothetical protein
MALVTVFRTASSSQIGALLSQSSASATYLTKVSASTTYLTQDSASTIYLPQASASSTYLTQASASTSYLTQASASSTYLTQASASTSYLTQASASVTYAPIVPTTQTGFRNVLINGDMKIDQRRSGSSFNVPGAGGVYTYATDRWFAYSSNTQALTQRLYASGYYYTRIAVNSSLTALTLGQRIESINSYHLAGKTVTLSFRMSSTASSITWAASYANTADTFGTQASPTVTSITSGTVTPTSSFANYSVTFSIPSNATTGLQITFTTASEFGINLELTNVQLELGSAATPFEQRSVGTELSLCQRYYQTSFAGSGVAPGHNASGNGIIYNPGVSGGISGNIYTNIRFPFMRVSPAVNIWNGNNASATPATASLTGGLNTSASGMRIYTAGGVGYDSTNIGIDYIRNDSISLYAQASTGGAASGILAFGYSLNAEL